MTDRRADIFVSYRHREPHATWVRETLVPALQAEGYSVIVDVTDFPTGRALVDEMERAAQARLTVAVIDSSYRESGFVHFERALASRLIAVMRDPVDGLVAPGAVETVDLVRQDDPSPVVEAVHRVVRHVFILESDEGEEWVEGVLVPALDNSGVATEHNGDRAPGEVWRNAITLRLLRADRVVIVLSSACLRDVDAGAGDLVAYAAGDPSAATITVAADDRVDVYPLDRVDLRSDLCRLAGRELTADELAAFLPDLDTRDASRCGSTESS